MKGYIIKYLSKESTIETLKQIFVNKDSTTPIEAAKSWGRESYSEEENRRWFDKKMTHLKYYNFAKPVYTRRNSRRVLDKFQLTLEGKRAIGRVGSEDQLIDRTTSKSSDNLSPGDVMKIVLQFKKDHPEYQIVFDVRLKEEQEEQ